MKGVRRRLMRGDIRLLMTASCLGNPMDKGGWATARGLAESDTTEKTHTHTHTYLMCLSSVGSLLRRGDGAHTHTHTHTHLMRLSSVGSLLRRGDGTHTHTHT